MQNMAESSAEMHAGNTRPAWERSSTRQAILDAARRLAAREDVEAITLSRVAAEAGFAPAAVYAYFVSKDDLHLAVVADDLEKLARAMRGEDQDGEEAGEADIAAQAGDDEAPQGEDGEDRPENAAVLAFPSAAAEAKDEMQSSADATPDETLDASSHSAITDDAEASKFIEALAEEGDDEYDAAGEELAEVLSEGLSEDQAGSPVAAEISLSAIEQAIGVVLTSADSDYVEDGEIAEEVPDAFPEEAIDEADEEAVSSTQDLGLERIGDRDSVGEDGVGEDGGEARLSLLSQSDDAPETAQDAPASAAAMDTAGMAEAIAQLQQTVARLETRPVDAWLERRLRVFERTLADIESRMEKSERDSMTALSTVSEGFKSLESRFVDTLENATQRATDGEQRHRAVAADLQAYVKDLSGRLGVVETSLSRLLGAGDTALPMRPATYADFEEPVEAPSEPAGDGDVAPSRKSVDESYLSAARRAANSAAAQADLDRRRGPLDYLKMPAAAASVPLSRRTLQLTAGVLALVVVLIVSNIILKSGAAAPTPAAVVTKPIVESTDARIVALAKAGNPKAELIAALKLLNGDGVATDVPSAAHWLKRAADQNEPLAQYWLGTLYERGRGVAKNPTLAMQWYEKAADAGNAKAMYRLAVGYAEGWNGEPDYVAAAKWFTKAAHFGIIDAQFNLAVLYERGQGVPESPADAFEWYAIAAAQGDAESKSRIDALATHMSSQDVTKAQAAAAKFQPVEPDPSANTEPDESDFAQGG